MNPQTALRKLETLLRSQTTVISFTESLEAEKCISALWEYVLLGKYKLTEEPTGQPTGNPQ